MGCWGPIPGYTYFCSYQTFILHRFFSGRQVIAFSTTHAADLQKHVRMRCKVRAPHAKGEFPRRFGGVFRRFWVGVMPGWQKGIRFDSYVFVENVQPRNIEDKIVKIFESISMQCSCGVFQKMFLVPKSNGCHVMKPYTYLPRQSFFFPPLKGWLPVVLPK